MSTPRILLSPDMLSYNLIAEDEVITENCASIEKDIVPALGGLLSVYYSFHLEFAVQSINTLTFLERLVQNLSYIFLCFLRF